MKTICIIFIVVLVIVWILLLSLEKKYEYRKNISFWLTSNPVAKTVFFVVSTIATGILCSALVTEISNSGNLAWQNFYLASSFLPLVDIIGFDLLYNWITYSGDSDILKFNDDEYTDAYIRKNSIEELSEKVKKDIREGKVDYNPWKKSIN